MFILEHTIINPLTDIGALKGFHISIYKYTEKMYKRIFFSITTMYMLQFVRLLCKYPQIELIVIAQTVTSELVLGLQERKP